MFVIECEQFPFYYQEGSTMAPQPFQLPNLPYEYEALEPVISGEIMRIHHTKHHQAYVNNLNAALEKYRAAEANNDIAAMVALQSAIKFNGGGHINHSIFWTNLAPKSQGGGEPPSGDLMDAIQLEYGSLERFIEEFSAQTVAIQGSGWGWLGYNKATGLLSTVICANQDPLSTQGLVPLLGIDVWEHAYYLQYKNVRADYVKSIWGVVNWKNVAERFKAVSATCAGCSCR
jgi:Fe-Mn family superoxide dismutase